MTSFADIASSAPQSRNPLKDGIDGVRERQEGVAAPHFRPICRNVRRFVSGGRKGWWIGAVIAAQLIAVPIARAQPAARPLPDPLDLDTVLAEARLRRHEPNAANARALAEKALSKQVLAPPDPMFLTSLDHIALSGDGVNASVMIEQVFPMSGILGARSREAGAEAEALRSDAGATVLDVESQAGKAFAMVAEAQAMREVIADQERVAAVVLDAATGRLPSGASTAADVARAELDVENLTAQESAADAQITSKAAMMFAAMGRPSATSLPHCVINLPVLMPLPADKLIANAHAHRPELLAMRSRQTAARADIDVMRSMYAPMGTARIGFAYTMTDKAGLMTALGITIPIWRSELDAGVERANQMLRMTKEDTSSVEQMIEGEVGSARDAVVAANVLSKALHQRILPSAEQALNLTLAEYGGSLPGSMSASAIPLVSVLESAKMLRDTRMQTVAADAQALATWIDLGRAVGSFDFEGLSAPASAPPP